MHIFHAQKYLFFFFLSIGGISTPDNFYKGRVLHLPGIKNIGDKGKGGGVVGFPADTGEGGG